jgi:hypothetical protein
VGSGADKAAIALRFMSATLGRRGANHGGRSEMANDIDMRSFA